MSHAPRYYAVIFGWGTALSVLLASATTINPNGYTRRIRWIALPSGYLFGLFNWRRLPISESVTYHDGVTTRVRQSIPIFGPYHNSDGSLNVYTTTSRTVHDWLKD